MSYFPQINDQLLRVIMFLIVSTGPYKEWLFYQFGHWLADRTPSRFSGLNLLPHSLTRRQTMWQEEERYWDQIFHIIGKPWGWGAGACFLETKYNCRRKRSTGIFHQGWKSKAECPNVMGTKADSKLGKHSWARWHPFGTYWRAYRIMPDSLGS